MANPVLLASIKSTNPMSDQIMSVLVVSDLTFLLPLRAVLARGGGTPRRFGWGCAAHVLKTLPYFRRNYVIFPFSLPYLDLSQIRYSISELPYIDRSYRNCLGLRKHLRKASNSSLKWQPSSLRVQGTETADVSDY